MFIDLVVEAEIRQEEAVLRAVLARERIDALARAYILRIEDAVEVAARIFDAETQHMLGNVPISSGDALACHFSGLEGVVEICPPIAVQAALDLEHPSSVPNRRYDNASCPSSMQRLRAVRGS